MKHLRFTLLFALLVFVGQTSSLFSQEARGKGAAKKITSLPFEITASGMYVLSKDLATNGTIVDAITVSAPDVVIDLGGHALSFSGEKSIAMNRFGIKRGIVAKNLRVINGTIQGFYGGISSVNGGFEGIVSVENVCVRDCGAVGIQLAAESVEVRNCRVHDITYLADSGDTLGISAQGAQVVVIGNDVGNVTDGTGDLTSMSVFVSSSRMALVQENRIHNNVKGTTALYCNTIAKGAMLVRNSISNFTNGLVVVGAGTTYYRSTLTQDVTNPFSGGTAVGNENN